MREKKRQPRNETERKEKGDDGEITVMEEREME